MKIKILYSHLNVSGTDYKARPKWFDFESCFKNLIKTISYQPNGLSKESDIEIHVIYDVTRGNLENNWIWKYFNQEKNNIIFHQVQGGTMEKAAVEMYKIAKELASDMKDEDIFYFLENDYFHIDGWVDKVKELFSTFHGLNYVTLYSHPDKYTPLYSDLLSKIYVTENSYWQTTPSTCGSYICTKKLFLEDYDIHTNMMGDHNKNIYLSEQKSRFILSPIPGLSTHCMQGLLSPTIDWGKINESN